MNATLVQPAAPASEGETEAPLRSDGAAPRREALLLLGTWLLACIWLGLCLHNGFLLEDDPSFAHQSERILQGEIPHVDYHEAYTGGLSYLGALSMRIFGVHLMAPRYALFFFFCAWVPAFWCVARRFSGPVASSLLTLLAVSWSVPLYPCPVPSWYNLFFATFGTAALMRYLEVRRLRWILLAGFCGGLSFLVKIAGLYFVAATGLFLLYDEQEESRDGQVAAGDHLVPALITAALLGFVLVLVGMVRKLPFLVEYVNFVLPGGVVCLILLYREWTVPAAVSRVRLRRLSARFGALLAGIVPPVLLFLLPYLLSGTLHKFVTGVFVDPQARLLTYVRLPIPIAYSVYALPILLLIVADRWIGDVSARRYCAMVVSAILALIFFWSLSNPFVASRVFMAVSQSIPLTTLLGASLLLKKQSPRDDSRKRLMLILSVVALCSVVQFPFSAPFYFCYVAALLALLLSACGSTLLGGRDQIPISATLIPFFVVYGTFVLMPAQVYLTQWAMPPAPVRRMELARGSGVIGEVNTVRVVEKVVALIQEHAGGAPIYAGPNASEFYFLAAARNATTVIYEFVSGDDGEPHSILKTIDAAGMKLIVLNRETRISGPPSFELADGLRGRFPEYQIVGPFEVRWRP